MDLSTRIETALRKYEPEEANWPTGDMVDIIVQVVREHDTTT